MKANAWIDFRPDQAFAPALCDDWSLVNDVPKVLWKQLSVNKMNLSLPLGNLSSLIPIYIIQSSIESLFVRCFIQMFQLLDLSLDLNAISSVTNHFIIPALIATMGDVNAAVERLLSGTVQGQSLS